VTPVLVLAAEVVAYTGLAWLILRRALRSA
jgi:hypothetical protein